MLPGTLNAIRVNFDEFSSLCVPVHVLKGVLVLNCKVTVPFLGQGDIRGPPVRVDGGSRGYVSFDECFEVKIQQTIIA